tara:strand:+ start:84 stop:227 length:144 start_codon:yes stop_codon:yes gene_type:complete
MKTIWKYRFFPAVALCLALYFYEYDEIAFILFLVATMDLVRVYKPSK